MQAAAAPSAPALAGAWEKAVDALGRARLLRMPQRRGPRCHEAARNHAQAMLFARGLNSGISHNPLESTTSDDMQLAVGRIQPCAGATGCPTKP